MFMSLKGMGGLRAQGCPALPGVLWPQSLRFASSAVETPLESWETAWTHGLRWVVWMWHGVDSPGRGRPVCTPVLSAFVGVLQAPARLLAWGRPDVVLSVGWLSSFLSPTVHC